MIRVLAPGVAPQMLSYVPDMTAGMALGQVSANPAHLQITVNGRRAHESTPVHPGTTVGLQPLGNLG